jgi:hypothetical protein
VTQFRLQTLLLVFVVLWSSLAVFGVYGIAVFIVVLLYSAFFHFLRSFTVSKALTGIALLGIAVALLLPARSRAREGTRLDRCVTNLAWITNALLKYRAENGRYPPAAVLDPNGKPMHSWRVLILPYLGETELYDEYDFDQPWNSPKNLRLAERLPGVFRCPTEGRDNTETETSYVALTGLGTAWSENIAADSEKQCRPEQLILLIEVAHSGVCWTDPRDSRPEDNFAANVSTSCRRLGSQHCMLGHVVCADGRIWRIPRAATLPAASLTTGAGGQAALEGLGATVISPPQEFTYPGWRQIAALPIWLLSVAVLLYRARRSRNL